MAVPAAGSVAAALNSMSAATNAASGTVAGRPAGRQLRPRMRLLGGRKSWPGGWASCWRDDTFGAMLRICNQVTSYSYERAA